MHTVPASHTKHRFIVVLGVSIFAVVVLSAVSYKLAVAYVFGHPLSDPNAGFTYLEPTALPAGYHITGKRLRVERDQHTHKLESLAAELDIGTRDWIYAIREARSNGQPVLTTLRNYDPGSTAITCTQPTSPAGRTYRLCHWKDWGTLEVYEVQFMQAGTYVQANFPAATGTVIPVQKLGQFVDSFAPADTHGVPVLSAGGV